MTMRNTPRIKYVDRASAKTFVTSHYKLSLLGFETEFISKFKTNPYFEIGLSSRMGLRFNFMKAFDWSKTYVFFLFGKTKFVFIYI